MGVGKNGETAVCIYAVDISGARIERVPSPSILVITKEGYMPDLYDITTHKEKRYKVVGLKDVSNLGIATEISLEEIV